MQQPEHYHWLHMAIRTLASGAQTQATNKTRPIGHMRGQAETDLLAQLWPLVWIGQRSAWPSIAASGSLLCAQITMKSTPGNSFENKF
jgi:hypothetical protein